MSKHGEFAMLREIAAIMRIGNMADRLDADEIAIRPDIEMQV